MKKSKLTESQIVNILKDVLFSQIMTQGCLLTS